MKSPKRSRRGLEEVYALHDLLDLLRIRIFRKKRSMTSQREAIRLWLHVLFLLDFVFGRKI